HDKGDFMVDDHKVFEVGGASKSDEQLEGNSLGYVAADDIEIGFDNKIPLWLFGFLY
ncbi:MAG: AAA family ATPase, partial [Campylobacterota bacterium]|nr:AAA family ATPase [Campylobacterota bacterium]